MTTTYNWEVSQMDRQTADGFVVTVHYRVSATDGTHHASTYGSQSYPQKSGETYAPYENLTQDIVIGWVQNSLGKDVVEASLQGQIDALITPKQTNGLPWIIPTLSIGTPA